MIIEDEDEKTNIINNLNNMNLNKFKTMIKQAYFQEMVTFFNDNNLNDDLNDVKKLYKTFSSSFVKFLTYITESKAVRNAFSKKYANGFQKFVDTKKSLYKNLITNNSKVTIFTGKHNTIDNSERFLKEIQSLYENFKSNDF